jgi:integrating conjugative element protein (TIGR03757 family)
VVVSSPYFIFIIALAGVFSGVAIAGDDFSSIEVFTDSRTPVRNNHSSATVYKVDRIDRLQQVLSEGLPSDPETAKQAALHRFQGMDAQISSELENAAKGLVQAMQYGIDRYPAIVFDGKTVVYGVTDVQDATRIYEQWQEEGKDQ